MKVVLGLGNPGPKYAVTRHNVGWMVLDHLADVWRFEGWRRDGDSFTASGLIGTTPVRLVKPQTYYNLTGQALKPFLRRAGFDATRDLLAIGDDVNLPVGTFRFRASGSSGGSNGLRSIEGTLGHQQYARLRVGIAPNDEHRRIGDLADFVLSPLGKLDAQDIQALYPRIVRTVERWLSDGPEAAVVEAGRN